MDSHGPGHGNDVDGSARAARVDALPMASRSHAPFSTRRGCAANAGGWASVHADPAPTVDRHSCPGRAADFGWKRNMILDLQAGMMRSLLGHRLACSCRWFPSAKRTPWGTPTWRAVACTRTRDEGLRTVARDEVFMRRGCSGSSSLDAARAWGNTSVCATYALFSKGFEAPNGPVKEGGEWEIGNVLKIKKRKSVT